MKHYGQRFTFHRLFAILLCWCFLWHTAAQAFPTPSAQSLSHSPSSDGVFHQEALQPRLIESRYLGGRNLGGILRDGLWKIVDQKAGVDIYQVAWPKDNPVKKIVVLSETHKTVDASEAFLMMLGYVMKDPLQWGVYAETLLIHPDFFHLKYQAADAHFALPNVYDGLLSLVRSRDISEEAAVHVYALIELQKLGVWGPGASAMAAAMTSMFFNGEGMDHDPWEQIQPFLKRVLQSSDMRALAIAEANQTLRLATQRSNALMADILTPALTHPVPHVLIRMGRGHLDTLIQNEILSPRTQAFIDGVLLRESTFTPPVQATAPFLVIDARAWNVLENRDIREAIHQWHQEIHDPATTVGEEAAKIQKQLEHEADYLGRLGRQARLEKGTVLYPFGGFDSWYPYAVSSRSDDVLSIGAKPFGSLQDVLAYSRQAAPFLKAGARKQSFDSEMDFQGFMRDDHLTGLGPLAMARIMTLLGGEITGLYYFTLGADGRIQWAGASDIAGNGQGFANAVIEFSLPNTSHRQRFWYVEEDILNPSPGLLPFISQVSFKTLMFKGTPTVLFFKEPSRTAIIRTFFTAAKRQNARVLTDERIFKNGSGMRKSSPYPIWERSYAPEAIVLGASEQFGYSSESGRKVFAGDARGLMGETSFVDEVVALSRWVWQLVRQTIQPPRGRLKILSVDA